MGQSSLGRSLMAVLLWCLRSIAEWFSAKWFRESWKESNSSRFPHFIHRYFVFRLRIALTSMKQLFSLAGVDG